MTNEQVKGILHKAVLVYIDSLSDDEYFTDKQLEVLTANKIIGKALEKQIKYKWHDLRRYPNDLPKKGQMVLTEIYGSDFIVCQEGETVEDAMERIFSKHYTTAGWLDDDGWNGLDGYPMIVQPSLWKEIEPYD